MTVKPWMVRYLRGSFTRKLHSFRKWYKKEVPREIQTMLEGLNKLSTEQRAFAAKAMMHGCDFLVNTYSCGSEESSESSVLRIIDGNMEVWVLENGKIAHIALRLARTRSRLPFLRDAVGEALAAEEAPAGDESAEGEAAGYIGVLLEQNDINAIIDTLARWTVILGDPEFKSKLDEFVGRAMLPPNQGFVKIDREYFREKLSKLGEVEKSEPQVQAKKAPYPKKKPKFKKK